MRMKKIQAPPLQFRPGPDLEGMVKTFAAENGLQLNEASKTLVALAMTGMDCSYYGLVKQMATALAGRDSFVRACVYIQTALTTAERVHDHRIPFESERSRFIYQTVEGFLSGRGIQLDKHGLKSWPHDESSEQRGGTDQQALPAENTEQVVEAEQQEPPTKRPQTKRAQRHILNLPKGHDEDY